MKIQYCGPYILHLKYASIAIYFIFWGLIYSSTATHLCQFCFFMPCSRRLFHLEVGNCILSRYKIPSTKALLQQNAVGQLKTIKNKLIPKKNETSKRKDHQNRKTKPTARKQESTKEEARF